MKKLLIFTLIIMMCISLEACTGNTTPTEETSSHTLPPTETIVQFDPEWAEVNCDIKLTNGDAQDILSSEDFETFAVIGTNDDDSYIEIKVTKDAVDIVKSSNLEDANISINDTYSSSINIDPATFDGKIQFGSSWTYEQLCAIASNIRGLY